MNEPLPIYEVLPAVLRGYEHSAGETCAEQKLSPANMCALCRSAEEMERLYKDYKKYQVTSRLYENMRWDLATEAENWRAVAFKIMHEYGDPNIIENLTKQDIEHILQTEFGRIAGNS